MNSKKYGLVTLAILLLICYNGIQPALLKMRTMNVPGRENLSKEQRRLLDRERYGPSMAWLDRLRNAQTDNNIVKLDFRILSSMMIAGLASGFKSQVANLIWMKSDEYWHKGLITRQVPLMEAVVTLDPQFVDAWSTAGWHWAYNIYADVEINEKYKGKPDVIRKEQKEAIDTGLDYLKRGAEMNPETYRLWFEHGYTRSAKAGLLDEKTIELFRRAREQGDARTIEQAQPNGQTIKVNGIDLVGRTIGHIYEDIPQIDKALAHYGSDLLKATPQQQEQLQIVGEFWSRYGSQYDILYASYKDPAYRAQIKKLVPDIERLVRAHETRMAMASQGNGEGSQPTGAYVSIAARYLPTWKIMQEGEALQQQGNKIAAKAKFEQAVNTMIGVMNGQAPYHLRNLSVTGEVLELRGDAPAAVQEQLQQLRNKERDSSQSIGLHFLAKLYEKWAAAEDDATKRDALRRKAYETWYRARARSSLNFYAKRQTLDYEDKYGFTPPQAILDEIKKSRSSGEGVVDAAPPPNVPQYQTRERHSDE